VKIRVQFGKGANDSLPQKELVGKCYTEPRVGSCEHGNEPSGSIKGGEFVGQLCDCQLLKKDSASWNYLFN
jgi:hypothetical protein